MVVERRTGTITHHRFKDITQLTGAGDFFVVNNSGVIPVKLFGYIQQKQVEILIVRTIDPQSSKVEAYTLPAKKFVPGARLKIQTPNPDSHDIEAEVLETGHRGKRVLRFNVPLDMVLSAGYAPLPPYIKRKFPAAVKYRSLDLRRYQTVYSSEPGSIAAPTAGLHFTPEILQQLKTRSDVIEITLDVGEATFQKIETEDIMDHRMGEERITITHSQRQTLNHLKQSKNLVAVGTTSVRSLESLAQLQPGQETFISDLFISPGYSFKMVDKLVTNFHLPQSSLFILVSAFAGLDLMQKAYRIAIDEGYRFFSYGDAMFIT